uniref:Alpha-macroglobulin receptor-binding domain-containing protein n=1 Tax=Sander lucioperca TaxID=283035 RepID=A0A8C9XNC6_SANLU
MGRPGIQMWTWKLCVLSWMCVGQAVAGPQYMVAIPAILESGAETKFCASLLQPSETLEMSVTLMSQEKNTILLKKSSSKEFHTCTEFKVPLVQDEMVQNFVVEVRGNTFYSKEVRKVKIKVYRPMTFIQTEKPIYLPGQTVHFRVITLDTKLRPVNQLVSDSNSNRIGQWLNETSNSKILQLSYALNSEAREGAYQVTVSIGLDKIQHSFKVEKYVLPKFDLQINASDEVSINREEIKAEVCATYTYGQPVPGSVDFKVCRPLDAYVGIPLVITREHPEGIPEIPMPCYKETKQTDKRGCATFIFTMSTFTKIDQKVLRDVLQLSANMEEEGTGISRSQEKTTVISYVVGKLSFTDTPKIYNKGSNVEGKVSAFGLHFNVILYTVQLKQCAFSGSSTVTVQSPSGQLMFDVNQNNKLLYQEKQLQDVTGKYSLEVKGTACAISLVYNIPTPADVTALSVEVKPEADCTSKRPKLSLNLTSLYSGKESSTNMVILDIKMLSGFVPDPESLNMLKRALLVDRVEQKEDHVLVYIRELPKNIGINHSLKLIQEHQVENLKPAVVKIYDYYQPSDQSDTEYINPCVAGKDL